MEIPTPGKSSYIEMEPRMQIAASRRANINITNDQVHRRNINVGWSFKQISTEMGKPLHPNLPPGPKELEVLQA